MKNNNYIKITFAIFAVSFLTSCAPKNNNIDFDFSKIKKTKKLPALSESKKINDNFENKLYVQDLNPLKNKDEILSSVKFGKKDPFSREFNKDIKINKLNLDLKLKGFLNTDFNKYAIVTYQEIEGALSEESVGGLNTNLLPKSAKVIKVDPKNKELTINFENKNFILKL